MTIADFVLKRPIISLAVLLSMLTAVAPSSAAVSGKGFWQETQSDTCSFVICVLDYSAVPAAKQVTITTVSCAIRVNGAAAIAEVKLGSKSSGGNQQANFTCLTVTRHGVNGSFNYYSINNAAVHILRPGDKANITVTFATSPTGELVNCTLGGIISA